MDVELLIQNGNKVYAPVVEEGIVWETERKDSPGKLTFTVIKDQEINFTEGNPVRLVVDGVKLFYGFIFSKKRDKQQNIKVTAYDQLRYLKNKDTYVYTNKTASDFIKGENFDYTSSIDSQTYNKIKLVYENEKTGKREVYIAQDSNNINNWGILQYYDTLQEGENGQAKVDALLSLYNAKTRNLKITNAFGNLKVRAGSMVVVNLNLGDVAVQNFMLVERCKHTFNESEHKMDLTLRGGEFIA